MTQKIAMSLGPAALAAYVARQLSAFFPDSEVTADDLQPAMPVALERLEHCFAHIDNKYFFDGGRAVFSHLHGDQYAMWLYLLANELHRQRAPVDLCSKLFLLNKALHGCDIFHEVELPAIFLLVHPVGTVLGRARYSDYFVSYQRVSVGSNHDVYPVFGEHVTLRPGAAVLGRCTVGRHCQLATESLLIDRDLPDHSRYIGNPKTAVVRREETLYPLWRRGPEAPHGF
ncbi:MAG: serine acetyltransferase [Pseudomonadota bacterium]|nr:serine acetyltransferase [Pseudomonadota bacterium]